MAKSELDLRELAANYGLVYDELQGIPELKSLFQEAVAQNYSAARFKARLESTNWWRNTPDTRRQFIDLQYTDPATWNQKWDATVRHVNDLAVQMGIPDLTGPGTGISQVNWALRNAAMGAMADGWSDDRVKSYMGGLAEIGTWAGNPIGGEMARNYSALQQVAYLNGRNYTPDWYMANVSKIAGGHMTMDQLEGQIRQEAASEYKGFSQQILAGQDAMTLAAPYVNAVSTLLEKPQGSIGLNDPLMRKAMTSTSKDGGAYSVWQLENDVRSDERWKQTDNARESLMKLGHAVLTDFGITH